MKKVIPKYKCEYKQFVLAHYLLSDYSVLLEYLISTYQNPEHPIFDDRHLLLFQHRLNLANQLIDVLDRRV